MQTRTKVGATVIALGLIPYAVEQTLNWQHPISRTDYHPVQPLPVIVTIIVVIIGAYIIRPKETEEVTNLIADTTVKIAQVVPFFGRRSGDKIAAAALLTHPNPAAVIESVESPVVQAIKGAKGDVLHIVPGASTAPSATDSEHDEVIP